MANGGSTIRFDQHFATQDPGFVDTLRSVRNSNFLAGFAYKWAKDPRQWARAQFFAYLETPMNCQGDHPRVKRLFKHAER